MKSDRHRDRKLIFGAGKTLLIEPSGNVVASFNWKHDCEIIGEKIYHCEGRELQEVDLGKL